MNLTDYKLKKPETYFITQVGNDSQGKRIVEFMEVKSEKVNCNTITNADFFIHEPFLDKYRISEEHCGGWIAESKTRKGAILLMSNKLRSKKYQNGGFEKIVLDAIYTNGLSPRYEVKK